MNHRSLFLILLTAASALAAGLLAWAPIPWVASAATKPPTTATASLTAAEAIDALSPDARAKWAQAREAFRFGRHAAAYGRFVALADAGHAPSAEIALLMWRYGRELFGTPWSASPAQVRHWTALAVARARAGADWGEAGLAGE